MKQFKISDEELATYLEGMLSGNEANAIEDVMDVDTLEVLNVSRKAVDEFPDDKVIEFPDWGTFVVTSATPSRRHFGLAGFLGDCASENEANDNLSSDGESEE